MIVSASGPLDPAIGGLRTLYVSLNSPVVTLAALPVGPATALVAVHAPPADGATLVVCSARTGTVAFYTAAGSLQPGAGRHGAATADLAAETLLSFAESLGFLFDDALAPPAAPPELLARWQLWGGGGDEPPPPPPPDPLDLAPLDVLEPELALSKFRLPLAGAFSSDAAEAADAGMERAVAAALRGAGSDLEVRGHRTSRPWARGPGGGGVIA